jgi:hypothetical protein
MGQKLTRLREKATRTAENWMELVTFILAILAILLAVVQFFDSRHLKNETNDLLEKISTKYIGSFPDNIDEINGVFDRSHKELLVLADLPGYGFYYQPDKFDDYIKKIVKLRQAAPPTKIRMLFYSRAVQEKKLREEEFSEKDWSNTKNDTKFKDFFGTYHAEVAIPESYDDFIKDLLNLHKRYENVLCYNGVEIEHINQSSAIFFWLEDGNSSVVAINNRAGADRELSFRTSDGKLIDSLQSMFNRLWEDSQHDPQACHPERN